MNRIRGAAAVAAILVAGASTGCRATGGADGGTLENENRNLHGVIESQQGRIDELVASKVDLDRRVKQLEAEVQKSESAEKVVAEAKGEISAQVQEILDRFRADSDIEVERDAGGYRFVLRQAVLFESGQAKLTADGEAVLQRVADALRGGQSRISIEGHTDDRPVVKKDTLQRFPRGNIELSVGRSLAVWDYLVKQGKVSAARIAVAGFGEHAPRVPNDSDRNRWRNRRVEIRVADG